MASAPGERPPRRSLPPLVLAVLAPLLLWAIIFGVVPPAAQDFPLSDDWSYAKGALGFARGKGIHYFGWSAVPLLGQWLWALPFVHLFGMSHVALRVSTIVLSLLAIVACYDLLRRESGMDPRRAAFAAATLGLNPFFFLASGTFMSDLPSLAGALIALALYARAFRSGDWRSLLAAALVATLAVATRQSAVTAPLAAGLVLLQQRERRWRPAWAAGVVTPVLAGMAVLLWFSARPDINPIAPGLPRLVPSVSMSFVAVHAMGLSCLPLLALAPGAFSWVAFSFAGAVLAASAYWQSDGGGFPYLGNLLTPRGAMAGGGSVIGEAPLILDGAVRNALTVVGCIAAAWLVARIVARFRSGARADLLGLFTVLSLGLILTSPHVFDRYLLALFPWAILVGASGERGRPPRFKAGICVLALFGLASLALMHDWLAWNSARWALGRRAMARGIAALDIEGGFEWDGWHSPRAALHKRRVEHRGLMLRLTGGWFPKVTGRFALAFSQPPGTVRLDAEPYRLWLAPGPREFLLIAEEPTAATDPAASNAQSSSEGR